MVKLGFFYYIIYHTIKNFLFFLTIFFTFNYLGLAKFSPGSISAAVPFILGYMAIYFINSYGDRFYDLKYHGNSFYNQISSKTLYLIIFVFFVVIGVALSYKFSPGSVIWLLAIYLLSAFYSIGAGRLKDRFLIRFLSMGLAYDLKMVYCLILLGFTLSKIPISFVIIVMAFVSFFTCVYKGTNIIYKHKIKFERGEIELLGAFFVSVLILFSLRSSFVWMFILAIIIYTLVGFIVRWVMGQLGFL